MVNPGGTRRRANGSLVVPALGLGFLLLAARGTAADWPAWRGGVRAGRSLGVEGPVRWSPAQNIAWKAAIPGEGHSSPIVSGGAVYLTTARVIPTRPGLLQWTRLGLVAMLALFLALALRFIGERCRGRLSSRSVGGLALFLLAALSACALVLFGEKLLDFSRAVERPWLAAGLVGTLCLLLAGAYVSTARPLLMAGASCGAFALLLGATIPDAAHSIRLNVWHPLSLLIYAVIALPAVAALWAWSMWLSARRTPSWRPVAGAVLKGAAAVMVLAFLIVPGTLLPRRSAATEETYTTASAYEPLLPWGAVVAPLAVLLALGIYRRKVRDHAAANAATVLAGAALGLTLLIAVAEHTMARVRFLHYLYGAPEPVPILGWGAVSALAVAAVIGAGLGFLGGRRTRGDAARLPPAFRTAAVGITLLYFVYANAMPKEPLLERAVVSVDRRTGAIRWISSGPRGHRVVMHSDNSPATPTPVTDGQRVFAYFGTPGLLCVDTEGRFLWLNTQLPFETREGVASSPVLVDNKILVLSESDAGNYLAAVDCETGAVAWRTERHQESHSYAGNCRTPTPTASDGRPALIVWGAEDLTVYDVATGRELRSHAVGDLVSADNPVAGAVAAGGRLYLVGQDRAVCLDTRRLLHVDPVLWERDILRGVQCSTPVLWDGRLFGVTDDGEAFCLNAGDGRELWREQLEGQHYASPVADRRAVYFCSTRGGTTVMSNSGTPRVLSRNDLGEGIYASPALVDGALYIRTEKHLYRIEERGPASAE